MGDFFRFLLYLQVLKFWSHFIFWWKCTCYTSLKFSLVERETLLFYVSVRPSPDPSLEHFPSLFIISISHYQVYIGYWLFSIIIESLYRWLFRSGRWSVGNPRPWPLIGRGTKDVFSHSFSECTHSFFFRMAYKIAEMKNPTETSPPPPSPVCRHAGSIRAIFSYFRDFLFRLIFLMFILEIFSVFWTIFFCNLFF